MCNHVSELWKFPSQYFVIVFKRRKMNLICLKLTFAFIEANVVELVKPHVFAIAPFSEM